jgi:hypothetical protein
MSQTHTNQFFLLEKYHQKKGKKKACQIHYLKKKNENCHITIEA